MNRNLLFALSAAALLLAACRAQEPAATTESTPPASTAAPAATPPPAQAATPPAAAPAGAGSTATSTASAAAAPAAAGSLASQETNWPGIAADVTEFKRKGNTLTAKVVLRNHAGADAEPDINYKEVYLMDLVAGKKYEVLKDEKGAYIAALRTGWNDRWYQKIEPGQSFTIWIKFPAPPADVKSVTLQLPGMPPFEDLAIQDV